MTDPIIEFRKPDLEQSLVEIHREGIARFSAIVDSEQESRDLAIEDKIFVEAEGGAYADNTSFHDSTEPEPPRYQIDRVTPVLEQALSDQRQNEIQIQVRGTSQSDEDTDNTMNGLIKNIESTSDAGYAYDNAFDETQKCGYGGWQIVTEYADDSFDQNIRIRPIKDAASSLFFGKSDMYNKEDALYAFLIWYVNLEEFKSTFPESDMTQFPDSTTLRTLGLQDTGWFNKSDDMIRLGAYWRKKPVKREIVQMTNGKVYEVNDAFKAVQDELKQPTPENPEGITIQVKDNGDEMRRKVDTYDVERYIMSGSEILKGPQKWLGKYIPLVPEYGVQTTIQGKEIVRGRVRKTKDASRVYNYAISAAVKAAAISPQDLLMLTPEQADGHVQAIEDLNISDAAALIYNHVEGQPAPFRTQSRQLDNALIGISQVMAENIAATVGGNVGTPTDGTAVDPRSGEAILQGQAVSEKGNAIYMANHIRSVSYGGKILADLLPRIKTATQQERIINPDGTTEIVLINKTVKDLNTNEDKILNDLSVNKYDIVPDVGPAYASRRQQGAAQLQSLAEKNPAFASRPDLIAKNLDIPDAKELHKSLREQLINTGAIKPTDEEKAELGIDERQQLIAEITPQLMEELQNNANIRLLNATAAMNESQAQANTSRASSEEVKTIVLQMKESRDAQSADVKDISEAIAGFKKMLEALTIQSEMGIPFSQQDHDNRITQAEVVESQQQEVNEGPNSEQLDQFNQVVGGLDTPAPDQLPESI